MLFWGDYRITVLQDRLLRIEKNNQKIYRDEATQSVWFRNTEPQDFSVEGGKGFICVKTRACSLYLSEKLEDCYVLLGEKKCALNNAENLKGTYRTLDRCDGNRFIPSRFKKDGVEYDIELDSGVCSKNGVAVINDAGSLSLGQSGEVLPKRGVGNDLYVFAYGNDYRAAVRALYLICGAPPIVPRFALGNWWSRYHEYTDKEYLRLLQRFSDNNVPLTVATVDMDWHYSVNIDEELGITRSGKNTPEYVGDGSLGWTGYSWNKNLFPDYKKFLVEVKARGLKITLNLHPADGVRWWESAYNEMARALGLDPINQKQIPFDFTNADFINAYFAVLHEPYEKDGVDFWWIDWQQGTKSKLEGLDPLWSLNHYHYYQSAAHGKTPLILSRYAGIGSHRYPLGFSGDTHITWKTLQYLPYFTATASNVGYTWWSHDIGGHMLGNVEGELYLRHVQFGVFSPVNRLHSSDAKVTTKEPWYYGNGIGEIAMNWLRLRHAMLPFLYTCSVRTHREGRALVEPLYYEWNEEQAYEFSGEYLFGGSLLVAPVVTPAKNGFAATRVWLPKGKWIDIFTGDEYDFAESKAVEVYRGLNSIPVFAKPGTILPFSLGAGNSCENPEGLGVCAYSGNGSFELFEDGREHGDESSVITKFSATNILREGGCFASGGRIENGESAKTQELREQRLEFYAEGDIGVIPKNRVITLYFKDIKEGAVSVLEDGKECKTEEKLSECVCVEIKFSPKKRYCVSVVYNNPSPLKKAIARVQEILLRAETGNLKKNECFSLCEKASDVAELKGIIENCDLPNEIKLRLLEVF